MLNFPNIKSVGHKHTPSKVIKGGRLNTTVEDFIWKPNKNHLNLRQKLSGFSDPTDLILQKKENR